MKRTSRSYKSRKIPNKKMEDTCINLLVKLRTPNPKAQCHIPSDFYYRNILDQQTKVL
jgi:hypothetical protein